MYSSKLCKVCCIDRTNLNLQLNFYTHKIYVYIWYTQILHTDLDTDIHRFKQIYSTQICKVHRYIQYTDIHIYTHVYIVICTDMLTNKYTYITQNSVFFPNRSHKTKYSAPMAVYSVYSVHGRTKGPVVFRDIYTHISH